MSPPRSYRFYQLYFEATRGCNLSCPHCMAGCNDRELVQRSKREELSYQEVVDLVLEPARELSIEAAAFSGGEFLLRKDALDLIRAAAALGFKIRVLTNATLVDEDMILALKQAAGPSLGLIFGINSIDDGQVNDQTRDAGLDTVLEAIELCRKHSVSRHVSVTLGKFNLDTLDSTLDWLGENRIPFNRAPLTARNSGKEWFDRHAFDREDMEQVIHPAMLNRMSGYTSMTPFFLSPELHRETSGGQHWNGTVPQNPSIGCWCGSWISVSPEGDVAPCSILQDDLVAGNVRDASLHEIVDSSPIFQQLLDRDQLKGKCGRCRYKQTCGGCRAMAYYHHGDYLAEDPTCFFEPVDEGTVSPFEERTNRVYRSYLRLAARTGMYTKPAESAERGSEA